MPAATVHHSAGTNHAAQTPAMVVPFVRAAKEHIEPFTDVSISLTGSTVQLGPYDVPAYGFMRGIYLLVQATGGSGTATVGVNEDAPWSAIQEVALLDVNGAPIVGPLSGYDLYLIQKWGGYKGSNDPKQSPVYSAPVTGANGSGNFAFLLRLPVEVSLRDACGALANQNASSTYKLRFTLNSTTALYSTAPTTPPTVRVRAFLEAWTQPTANDLRGNANATTPPAHGTTSYWSKTVVNLANGFNTVRLPRVGNYIRHLIFVARDATNGTRATGAGNFPDPAQLYWDTRLLKNYTKAVWQAKMQESSDYGFGAAEAARGLDNGVFTEPYCIEFDGNLGRELRDMWLPTVQSTRLELAGTFAGSTALTILTNDVSPAGEVFI